MRPADSQETERLLIDKERELLENQHKIREFEKQEPVYVQAGKEKIWEEATVLERHGESSPVYDLLYNNRVIKKHADKIKKRTVPVIQLEKQKLSEAEKTRLRVLSPERSQSQSQSGESSSQSREQHVRSPELRGGTEPSVEQVVTPAVSRVPDQGMSSDVSPGTNNTGAMLDPVRRSARLASRPQVKYDSQL